MEACKRARVGPHRFMRFGPFALDTDAGTLHDPVATGGGNEREALALSTGECKVLAFLIEHCDERITPERLAVEALGRKDDGGRLLAAQYVRGIRRILGAGWRHLLLVGKGKGYRILES